MTTISVDTRIEKIQLEMLRQVSPAQKMRIMAQTNYAVRTFMIAVLKQGNPEVTPDALRRMAAKFLRGDELARKVCDYHRL